MCDAWAKDAKAFCDYIKSLPNYDKDNLGRGKLTIDRIDNDGDYGPGNVRLVNCHIQAANQRIYKCNSTGFRGVSPSGKKFQARIRVNTKLIHLGSHATPELASQARLDYINEHNLIEYL